MPKSKVRKKNDFTINPVSRTPVKVKAGPSSTWFVVLFVGLMLIGLVWLIVFQLAGSGPDVPSLLQWMADLSVVELRHRVCLHDHRVVAHHALAVTPASPGMNSSWLPARSPAYATWTVTRSHRCDSSPLWIAPVDNSIRPR